MLGIEIETKY